MDHTVFSQLQKRPRILSVLIVEITAIVLILNAYGLAFGITNVLPHLFYIPIIITAYFFPRRGIFFACVLSAIYCSMTYFFNPTIPGDLLEAGGRVILFLIIAAVVSYLTLRMQESEHRHAMLLDAIPDIMFVITRDGVYRDFRASEKSTLAIPADQIIGKSIRDTGFNDELVEKIFQHIARAIDTNTLQRFEYELTMPQGIRQYEARIVSLNKNEVLGIVSDITERKQMEMALRESEEKYRMLADYTYDWEYWIAPDETILYTTPSCERITGYTAKEFAEDKGLINRIIHHDDSNALDHHMAQGFTRQQAGAIDFRIIHRNGDIRWIGHVCQPIYNARGEFIGRRSSNRDITARKRVEYELRDANRRLTDIIDFLPDPTMVIDVDGKVSAWNQAMEKLTEIHAASILGKGDYAYAVWFYGKPRQVLIDLVLHDDQDSIRTLYPNYRRNGHTILAEIETQRPDGTRLQFWIDATPLFNQNGETIGAIESLRDVTHQKMIARALRESKNYFDAIINTISDPVFVKDRQHRFVTLNDGFCRFVKYTRENLLGKTDYDFFPKEDADVYRKKDEEVFSSRTINENEETLTDAHGNRHTIVTKKSLYVNGDGEEFLVGIIRDISERKQMETALREVNKKLNLLSSITRHDIRNQLLSLTAYLELSKETLGDAAKTSEYIIKEERAATAIERQILFTKEYQDLGVKAPVWQNISLCLKTAVAVLPVRDIYIVDEISGLEIYTDPLFQKVFYNLIDNALRYGGTDMTTIRFSYQESGPGMIISVADNGIGITAEDKKRLFERGFGHHTGLGLFLSREILSITGITITESGEPGNGARFEIVVPNGAWRRTGTS